MLASIIGGLGSGKTLFMVQRALMSCPDKDVYANFHIDLPNCTLIGPDDVEDIRNGIMLLDEGYLWIDSRNAMSGRNRKLSYEIFKSRKKKLDIWVSTQLYSAIDNRYRDLNDILVVCNGLNKNRFDYQFFEYYLTGYGSNSKHWYIPLKYAENKLFPIYDTDEFPEENYDDENDLNEVITAETEALLSLYTASKITKGVIKDWLLSEHKEQNLTDPIFNRIKRLSL